MRGRQGLWRSTEGATAVEVAILAPVFVMLLFGILEGGLALWTQVGLQYGVEAAARCAAVDSTRCGNASAVAGYAAQQTFGLSVPASDFTVTTPACGDQVQASYTYQFVTLFFGTPSVTLKAQSCFPT